MSPRVNPLLGFPTLALLITACATAPPESVRTEPRPLGREIATFRAPSNPNAASRRAIGPEEPDDALTLRDALGLALAKNPELAAFSWEVRAREATALQEGLWPNPELELEVEEFGGTGELGGFQASEATLRLGQLIELAGKRGKRRRLALLGSEVAAWRYETKRLEVFTDVTRTFVEVLAAQERLSLSEELVRLAEEALETVSRRVEAGRDSPVERARAEVELHARAVRHSQAQRILVASRKHLAALWGASIPTFERASGTLDTLYTLPEPDLLDSLLAQNPEMAESVARIEAARAQIDLAEARRVPDVTLSAGFKRLNEVEENAFLFGLSLPLPVFDRNQGSILEARHGLRRSEAESRATEASLRSALANAYEGTASALAEAEVLRSEIIPEAREIYREINEGYRVGRFDFLDLLDAQRTLFQAREQLVEALARFHRAAATLEGLVARPISHTASSHEPEQGERP
jgi:cobalt-zinc-cadmium efflux system outer membrane protein